MGNALISRITDISQKADLNHKHDAKDIKSGTLNIEMGGTGADTAEQARRNLNVPYRSLFPYGNYDINNIVDTGFYIIARDCENVPPTTSYYTTWGLIVFSLKEELGGERSVCQICIPTADPNQKNAMWIRQKYYYSSSYTWTEWKNIGNSVNIVQNTGESETDVMSQKAVTNSIENIGIDTKNSMLSSNSTRWINYYADKKNLYNVNAPNSLQIASSNGITVAFTVPEYVHSSYKDAWGMYTLTYPSTYSVLNSPKFQKQEIKGIEYPYGKTWFLTSSQTEYYLINSSDDLLYTGTITNGIVSDTVTSQSVILPIKSSTMSFTKVGGRFFLQENSYGSFALYTSSDGISWTEINGEIASCMDIKAYNNAFYICEYHGIYRSTDGVSWEKVFTSGSVVYALFYNSNTYTAFVGSSQIATSEDGINWTTLDVNNEVGVYPGNSTTVYDYSKNQYACMESENIYYLDSTLTWVLSKDNSLSNVQNGLYLVSDSTSMVALTFYNNLTYKFSLLYTGENPSYTLNISNGGTGATTPDNARNNLSVYSKLEVDQKIKDILPEAPPNQGTYTLKSVNGVLEWSEQ